MIPQRRDIWTDPISAQGRKPRPRLARWREAVGAVIASGGPEIVFQPVVDLNTGEVAGYEALARFGEWGQARPEEWFARAGQVGLGPALEAAALGKALRLARTRTPGQFIAVNLTPDSLLSDEVQSQFEAQPSLKDIVIELTEHHPSSDPRSFRAVLANARQSGARLAVDDTGSDHAALNWIGSIEPDIVKLDRSIVSGIDGDPAKLALAEMLGAFAARINASVLAEGIARREELDALLSVDIPLAQGFLFGAPGEPWTECEAAAVEHLRERNRLSSAGSVGSLVEVMPAVPARTFPAINFGPNRILLDDIGRPVGFCLDGDSPVIALRGLSRVETSESAPAALTRAMSRDADVRWHPLACNDESGETVGLVRIEVLAKAVARSASS